jgi:hypothetical protein
MATFKGPAFPVTRPLGKTRTLENDGLILEDHRHDERIAALKAAHLAAQDTLRTAYGARIAAIKADTDLTVAGKNKRLQGLRTEFEQDLAPHVKAIAAAEDWAGRSRKWLTAPPDGPKDETSYQGTARAMREHRAVSSFIALPPPARREALRRAREAGERDWLAALANEPGLLSAQDHAAIAADLMRTRDRGEFGQLTELCGAIDPDTGVHDAQQSALEITRYALDACREWMAAETGVEPTAADVLRQAGIRVDGAALELTPEQAHSVEIYRAARDHAATAGKIVSISGDEGTSAMDPGATSNGNGGEPPKTA